MSPSSPPEVDRARAEISQGHYASARQRLEALAQTGNAEARHLLAILYARTGELQRAEDTIQALVHDQSGTPVYWLTAANIAQDRQFRDLAVERAHKAIALDAGYAEAYNNLGILLSELGRHALAKDAFSEAVRLRERYPRAQANLAGALVRLGLLDQAEVAAEKAIQLDETNPSCHFAKGHILAITARPAEAEPCLRKALQLAPSMTAASLALIKVLLRLQRVDEALQVAHRALEFEPQSVDLLSQLAETAAANDDEPQLFAAVDRALAISPGNIALFARKAFFLPNIYASREHIQAVRSRFASATAYLSKHLDGFAPIPQEKLGSALPSNFLLAYQGENDAELQRDYASIVARCQRRVCEDLYASLPKTGNSAIGKIRIGFCGRIFYRCTAGNYFASWITELPRDRFEVFVYHVNPMADDLTKQIAARADQFLQPVLDMVPLAERIKKDKLDLLIYPEVGMDQTCYLMASMRLAPVQAAAWGHPVTTGHANLDFFLSCESMEPDGAKNHYTERLLLLPGIGTSYRFPDLPTALAQKGRADYLLEAGRVLALVPQSLFKIHPDNDRILVEVLHKTPSLVIVMFAGSSQRVTSRFVERLRREFARQKLDPAGRIKILPQQSHAEYLRINQLCDFMIDTFHWSGGNTSLDALACGLPIVTLPGNMMRGRQTAAMLQLMGIPELVAGTPEHFVELASRLAQDADWRQMLAARISSTAKGLFNDRTPIDALIAKIEQMVGTNASN
jgi:CRISPR-associated protein Csy1